MPWAEIFTGLSTVLCVVCTLSAVRSLRIAKSRYSNARVTRQLARLDLECTDLRDLFEELHKRQKSWASRQRMRDRREKDREPEPQEKTPHVQSVPKECPDPNVDPAGFKAWHRIHTLHRR